MNTENLNLYATFLAVAKAGSILGASEQLYISQPAVSKSIKKLEQNLNTTLFVRSSKGVRLTEDGELLYNSISSAFEYIDSGEASILSRGNLGIGHIRIGVSNTLCKYVLLPYLSKYTETHPHVGISIECQSSGETAAMLHEGKVDIGLIARPTASDYLDYISLGNIHDIFVATPQYINNLKARNSFASEHSTLANIMILGKSNMTRQYVEKYISMEMYTGNTILEIDNMELLIEFSKTGIGIGCVIKEFVQNELKKGELVEYGTDVNKIPPREICFAYPSGKGKSQYVEEFIDFISKEKLQTKNSFT